MGGEGLSGRGFWAMPLPEGGVRGAPRLLAPLIGGREKGKVKGNLENGFLRLAKFEPVLLFHLFPKYKSLLLLSIYLCTINISLQAELISLNSSKQKKKKLEQKE